MVGAESTIVHRYAGWSAYLSAGLSIIGGISLLLFYALELPRSLAAGDASSQFFGPLSDYAGLFQFLVMLPLTIVLHQLAPARQRRLSQIALALGVVGLLTEVIAGALLVTGIITFEVQLPYVMAGLVVFGAWMVLANHLGRAGRALPPRLTWLGEVTGAAFVLGSGLALVFALINVLDPTTAARGGAFAQQNPWLIVAGLVVAIPGFLAYLFGVTIWLLWLGRRLLAITNEPEQRDRQPAHAGA